MTRKLIGGIPDRGKTPALRAAPRRSTKAAGGQASSGAQQLGGCRPKDGCSESLGLGTRPDQQLRTAAQEARDWSTSV